MYIILYNPLSSRGKNKKVAVKLAVKLRKKDIACRTKNLLKIDDINEFINDLKDDDKIVICGGDGTIHRIVNTVDISLIKQEVYMMRAGSGNDFLRSIPGRGKLIAVKQYLKEFPILTTVNGSMKIINGAGVGLDGMVCHKVNQSKAIKNKSNYFRHALSSFLRFKPTSVRYLVDGVEYQEKKVWFVSTMYSSMFGGGMKIAAGKKRNDGQMELVVVRKISKLMLLIIFPTIYLGWHKIFKRWVKTYRANEVEVFFNHPTYFQADGEDQYPIDYYKVTI
jgi:diacylglycerol kinase family enzyme